ncbi:MAG: phytanoyl-CoA dioxygenase family protein [Alphaproteobacteria bacterium]
MSDHRLTRDDHDAFWRDGCLLKRGWFDAEEVAMLHRAIEEDEGIRANRFRLADSRGGATELALWNHPGDDLFGAVARSERIVDSAEFLIGGEVYHYHSKLTLKPPRAGGAWNWHQDYGYWYNNGCLFPDMLSVAIAVDRADRENGCLQVLRGSHKMGRIDHGRVGGQTGADMERVEAAMQVLERVHVEADPGDAFFFHCNLLHSSDPNLSERSRNVLLCCYNKATNNPVKEHHHPFYTPLAKLPDRRIKEIGMTLSGTAREFYSPDDDETVEAEGR